MATYQALQQKIADDLNRSDLTTQIQAAILAAVELHEAEHGQAGQGGGHRGHSSIALSRSAGLTRLVIRTP